MSRRPPRPFREPRPSGRRRGRFGMWGPIPYYSTRTRRGSEVSVGGCGCCLPIPLLAALGLFTFVRLVARVVRRRPRVRHTATETQPQRPVRPSDGRWEDRAVMQIGEVAARVGLSLRTIRHWDEVGLVVPSERSAGGFRLYNEADVERLALVKTLKPLDFSVEQMRDLLDTIDGVEADTGEDAEHTADLMRRLAVYRAAADGRVEALRAQVQGLETLSKKLRRLTKATTRG